MGDAIRRLGRPLLIYAAWGAALFITLLIHLNCRKVPDFPDRANLVSIMKDNGRLFSYDRDKDGKIDYHQVLNAQGRKIELRFATKNDEPLEIVRIDQLLPNEVPHFIIALDGVPYELVEQSYREGFFRLFYSPSRMISTFPSMTDLAFWKIFGGKQPIAYQAKHFDPDKNRVLSGDDLYLSGEMADWSKKLDYRCSFKMDALAYVLPQQVFEHELRGMRETLSKTTKDQAFVYSVATAGLGTEGGREAILRYLRQIDRFCEEIVYERRGRVKITVLADHGHNMSGRGYLSFTKRLEKAGFRVHDKIEGPRDVVTIKYGLVTYAAFFTQKPEEVTRVVLQDPAVTIACFPKGDSVIVQTLDGRAAIQRRENRYRYEVESGDPLLLLPILSQLHSQGKIDADGFIEDRALFDATVTHEYPDPLRRVWLAFHGIVKKPADLIVCLRDGWCHGSEFFEVTIGGATSTHGSLNQLNSATFVITMLDKLPPALRPEEVMPALRKLRMIR